VISTLDKLEGSRKCFRLIGGVLVERTVGEVLPAVKKNQEMLSQVLEQFNAQFLKREGEMRDFATKYKIRVRSPSEGGTAEETAPATKQSEAKTAGVLV